MIKAVFFVKYALRPKKEARRIIQQAKSGVGASMYEIKHVVYCTNEEATDERSHLEAREFCGILLYDI
jgi:hypothetical protein